ncbi:MAG: hypothetical protein ACT4RN_09075 [Pseudonocardia sp.]
MSGDPGGAPLRAATLAMLVTLLTALGHRAGGGALPDLALAAILLPLLAAASVAFAQRTATLPRAVTILGAGQVLLHHLLAALHPGSHHAADAVLAGPAMLAMHALATVAAAVLLCRADRAVAAVRAAVARIVPRRRRGPVVAVPLVVAIVPGPVVALRLARAGLAPVLRRGPPAAC